MLFGKTQWRAPRSCSKDRVLHLGNRRGSLSLCCSCLRIYRKAVRASMRKRRARFLPVNRAPGRLADDPRRALLPRFINKTTFVASFFGSGEARRGSIPRSGAVTEEQRSQNRKATQPSGRRLILAQTSLLTPYRPLKGCAGARAEAPRASSGQQIPRRKRGRIYEMGYLDSAQIEIKNR